MLTIRDDDRAAAATIGPWETASSGDDGAPRGVLYAPGARRSHSANRRNPVLVMVAGVLVVAVAAAILLGRHIPAPEEASAGTRPPAPAPASLGVAIGGPSDVAAQMATYAPGQSSGWHTHTGLHAVVVMSGTLTIVDGDCRRQIYGPGDSYVGGREVHLALNETAAPVEMAVTYMFPAGVSHTGFHIPAAAPAGCGTR